VAIAIVDYGMGNLHSVSKAVERLGYEALISSDEGEILAADGVILPGVGAFGDAMEHLREDSLDDTMRKVAAGKQPLLGICLGMQLLFSTSEEHGSHEGLGILPGSVVRFAGGNYKVPHMGWNKLHCEDKENPLFAGLVEGYVYFVHSYHVLPEVKSDVLATTDYGDSVTAIVGRDSIFGMQFHPEKSGDVGINLLRNFLRLTGNPVKEIRI
jgi:glutamine amidotransferase